MPAASRTMRLPQRAGGRAELRKSLKPLLEKRRRARINESLSRLRGLLLPSELRLGPDLGSRPADGSGPAEASPLPSPWHPAAVRGARCRPPAETRPSARPCPCGRALESRPWKLEKADILEMAVRFLRGLPAAPVGASPSPPPAAPTDSYREGYRTCLARLTRVLPACRVLEPAESARLLQLLQRSAAAPAPDGARAGVPRRPSPPHGPAPPAPPGQPKLWRPW